jgi:NADH-ubiquinone oxidoreductase chain 6
LSANLLTYTTYASKIQSWTNIESVGNLLYTTYFILFLVSSLILLVAMIGAIVLTMHKTAKVKRQDVFQQNAINFQTTIKKIRTINS